MKIIKHYDRTYDMLYIGWRTKSCPVVYSEEIQTKEGNSFVIDYDKKGRIVAIEIFGYQKGSESVRKNK